MKDKSSYPGWQPLLAQRLLLSWTGLFLEYLNTNSNVNNNTTFLIHGLKGIQKIWYLNILSGVPGVCLTIFFSR